VEEKTESFTAIVALQFLKGTLFYLVMACIDAVVVWMAWSFVFVPKFHTPALSLFDVLFALIGLATVVKVFRGRS
jgi:hypothetical protein